MTVSQQTPSSPPRGAETQMSKCDRPAFFVMVCSHSDGCLVSAGPPPPPSTISGHPPSPPPSLEPAVDQEVTSSPPHPQPQPHSGNMAVFILIVESKSLC